MLVTWRSHDGRHPQCGVPLQSPSNTGSITSGVADLDIMMLISIVVIPAPGKSQLGADTDLSSDALQIALVANCYCCVTR